MGSTIEDLMSPLPPPPSLCPNPPRNLRADPEVDADTTERGNGHDNGPGELLSHGLGLLGRHRETGTNRGMSGDFGVLSLVAVYSGGLRWLNL